MSRVKKSVKTGKKPGKVVRLDEATWGLVLRSKREREKTSTVVRRLVGLPPRRKEYEKSEVLYLLPHSKTVHETIAEARGAALVRWVKQGKKGDREKPVLVRILSA